MLPLVKTQHYLSLIRHNWNVQLAITAYMVWTTEPLFTSSRCAFSGHMLQMNRGQRQSQNCCVTSCVAPAWSADDSLLRSILADHSSKPSPPVSGWAFCHRSLVSRWQRRARQLLSCLHWSAFWNVKSCRLSYRTMKWHIRPEYSMSLHHDSHLSFNNILIPLTKQITPVPARGYNLKHLYSYWIKFLLFSESPQTKWGHMMQPEV